MTTIIAEPDRIRSFLRRDRDMDTIIDHFRITMLPEIYTLVPTKCIIIMDLKGAVQ